MNEEKATKLFEKHEDDKKYRKQKASTIYELSVKIQKSEKLCRKRLVLLPLRVYTRRERERKKDSKIPIFRGIGPSARSYLREEGGT